MKASLERGTGQSTESKQVRGTQSLGRVRSVGSSLSLMFLCLRTGLVLGF